MRVQPTHQAQKRRGVEQLVARRAHNPKVIGSNPISASNTTPMKQFIGVFLCPKRIFLVVLV